MTKTENYNLPQWGAGDPVRREDFNGAMASIEEGLSKCYTTERKPFRIISFSVNSSHEAGSVLYTFSEAPAYIIVYGGYGSALMQNGYTGQTIEYPSYNTGYVVIFRLQGTQLLLYSKGSSITSKSFKIILPQ